MYVVLLFFTNLPILYRKCGFVCQEYFLTTIA